VKGTCDNGAEQSVLTLQGSTSAYEETLGALVIEMLQARQNVSRQSLCIKLAARIDDTTDPLLEAHYCELLALMLGKKSHK